MEQHKSKCPTCSRTISKQPRYSITEFHRRVRKVTDIASLDAIQDYILRVIKFYFAENIFIEFTNELDRQLNDVLNRSIDDIKKWILSFIMNIAEPLKICGLAQMRNTSVLAKVKSYLNTLDKDDYLEIPFSQFYENFNRYTSELELRSTLSSGQSNLISQETELHDNVNIQNAQLFNNEYSKQSVARALTALGIHTKSKKRDNRSQMCLDISPEDLHDLQ